jgi:hypothetical protein
MTLEWNDGGSDRREQAAESRAANRGALTSVEFRLGGTLTESGGSVYSAVIDQQIKSLRDPTTNVIWSANVYSVFVPLGGIGCKRSGLH